ncbi:hypothetical protein H206_00561 [Candidatus Electrothrix aarhusensis]|uniref:Uncharacterized protein n=1 Tax=Candidatus Electrothrix aarhusensis TaxID=1859131 RepID=A0A444IQJ8_9BACT|nr:hypothetical protein H206_00561 [Candidatus Electrothrix aarhusensis]
MRKVTSLILVISGFIELITSILLYMAPSGQFGIPVFLPTKKGDHKDRLSISCPL